jgi:hypothetical protein
VKNHVSFALVHIHIYAQFNEYSNKLGELQAELSGVLLQRWCGSRKPTSVMRLQFVD